MTIELTRQGPEALTEWRRFCGVLEDVVDLDFPSFEPIEIHTFNDPKTLVTESVEKFVNLLGDPETKKDAHRSRALALSLHGSKGLPPNLIQRLNSLALASRIRARIISQCL